MEAAKIPAGMQIFAASPVCDDHITAAKEYASKNKLTGEDVKLMKSETCVYLEAKREIILLF